MFGGGMHGFAGIGGFGWSGMIIGLLINIALVVGVVWLVVWLVKRMGSPDRDEPLYRRPLEILQARYASGEITREQYEQMKLDVS